jgi:hypothetical protein
MRTTCHNQIGTLGEVGDLAGGGVDMADYGGSQCFPIRSYVEIGFFNTNVQMGGANKEGPKQQMGESGPLAGRAVTIVVPR